MEVWKPISEADGYFISNYGRVCSKKKDEPLILKTKIIPNGYEQVNLWNNSGRLYRYVHRLVAQAFLDNPENLPQVNHIDGKKNNNHVNNLEWISLSENQIHAFRTGLKKIPDKEKARFALNAKLTMSKRVEQITAEGNHIRYWDSACEVKRTLGYDRANIATACRKGNSSYGYKWRYA